MHTQIKYAVIHCSIWVLVAGLFIGIFASGNTVQEWSELSVKRLWLSVIMGIGIIGDILLRVVFTMRKDRVVKDESDDIIQKRAVSVGLVLTLLYVYIYAITVYTGYEAAGTVPTALFWFLAYSVIWVANITVSATALMYYGKMRQ